MSEFIELHQEWPDGQVFIRKDVIGCVRVLGDSGDNPARIRVDTLLGDVFLVRHEDLQIITDALLKTEEW